jgi:inner membrane protease subunit 2
VQTLSWLCTKIYKTPAAETRLKCLAALRAEVTIMRAAEWVFDIGRRSLPLVPVFFCIDHYFGTIKLVSGRSMQPTFNARGKDTNDAVLLDRWSARQLSFRRGDVVVLRSPHEPKEWLTKRVVGLPGDWVKPRGSNGSNCRTVPIPRGQLWVEGDNEHASNDSNSFGAVAAALVEARVSYKLWPLNEAGPVRRCEPATERLVHRSPCESASGATEKQIGILPWHLR